MISYFIKGLEEPRFNILSNNVVFNFLFLKDWVFSIDNNYCSFDINGHLRSSWMIIPVLRKVINISFVSGPAILFGFVLFKLNLSNFIQGFRGIRHLIENSF